MARVFIGVDPHKLSATIEVVDDKEGVLTTGRFSTDKAEYAAMRSHVRSYPDLTGAVEGSNGAGRPLAQRLLADGEHVVDVPANSQRGLGCSTPATTARPTRTTRMPSPWSRSARRAVGCSHDVELEALRMLVDRRDELSKARVQAANRLHRLLSELVPGQAKKNIVARFTDRNRFASWTAPHPSKPSAARSSDTDSPAPATGG